LRESFASTSRGACSRQSITLVKPMKIRTLIVDDEPLARRKIREFLKEDRESEVVGECAAGAQPVSAVRSATPDLLFLDVQMPGMDGFTVAQKIKANPQLASATILILTSLGRQGDGARCRELGVAAYLVKPIHQYELLEALGRCVRVSTLAKRPSAAPALDKADGRPLRILVAEDNAINQKVAVRTLEKQGHRVVVAETGTEALDALDAQSFDLILMDVQMPEMDGLEATARLREREKATGRHLPVIAMTAHAMKGDRERCLAAGMDGYVSKPVQGNELIRAIDAVVEGPPPAKPEPAPNGKHGAGFDREAALARLEGDEELLRELVGIFLEDCPRLLQGMREALAQGDATALSRLAHKLKGSAGYLEAAEVCAAAQRLESLKAEAGVVPAGPLLQALEEHVNRLLPALKTLVHG